MRPRPAVLFVTAALIMGARASSADDPAEPVHLEYRAPAGCPDRAAFEGHVRELTARARFDAAGPRMRTFEVRIESRPPLEGTLVVHRGDEIEGRRVVQADRCSDIDDALALMVALAIDPQASLTPGSAGSAARPVSIPSAAGSASAAPVVEPAPLAVATPPAREHAAPPRKESRPAPVSWRPPQALSIGVDLAVASGVAANPLVGASPSVEWRSGAKSLLSPALHLAFLRASSGAVVASGGAAFFTWTVGRLDGCGLASPSAASVDLLVCARLEAGTLEGVGSGIAPARESTRAWVALGPLMRVEWAFFPPAYVDVDVGPMFRVTADRFYFYPDSTIYEVPYVGLDASVGIGVHFL